MTTPDAAAMAVTVVAWENEGGALRPPPPIPGGPPPSPGPTHSWRTIATLGAVIAVWQDLSVGVRRRIAQDAMVAMSGVAQSNDTRT